MWRIIALYFYLRRQGELLERAISSCIKIEQLGCVREATAGKIHNRIEKERS